MHKKTDKEKVRMLLDSQTRLNCMICEANILESEIENIRKVLKSEPSSEMLNKVECNTKSPDIHKQTMKELSVLEEMIMQNLYKITSERVKLEKIMSLIKDDEMRLVARLRVIAGRPWEEIGLLVRVDRSSLSKKYMKYFTVKGEN